MTTASATKTTNAMRDRFTGASWGLDLRLTKNRRPQAYHIRAIGRGAGQRSVAVQSEKSDLYQGFASAMPLQSGEIDRLQPLPVAPPQPLKQVRLFAGSGMPEGMPDTSRFAELHH